MTTETHGGIQKVIWKKVWVIGASSGIGEELSLQFAPISETVIVSARREDKLHEIAAKSPKIVALPLDINNYDDVSGAFESFGEADAFPDLVIVCSGVWNPVRLPDLNMEDFHYGMQTNYLSVVNILSHLIPMMSKARRGHIGLVASVAGYRGMPNAAAYAPTKAALINLSECLRPQLNKMGVTLSLINPGFVETPMTSVNKFPMPFLMKPDEAAKVIVKGLKKRKYEIAFPLRLVLMLKFARAMPNELYFWLIRKFMLR